MGTHDRPVKYAGQTRTHKGFTLIELLVVIAIIAILAAILFPVFAKAREKARQTTCMNNAKQIATSILMFVQDHDETFPLAATWVTDLSSAYGVTGKVWDCPTSSFKGTESSPDYFFIGGSLLSEAALGDIKDPVDAPLLVDLASPKSNKPYVFLDAGEPESSLLTKAASLVDTRHNAGAVMAFVDGHLSWVNATAARSPITYLPSLVGEIKTAFPLGSLFANDVPIAEGPKTIAIDYGITTAIGRTNGGGGVNLNVYTSTAQTWTGDNLDSANAPMTFSSSAPSWWKLGPGGSSVASSNWDSSPCNWGSVGFYPLASGVNGTVTLRIVPKADAPVGIKRAALLLSSRDVKVTAEILSVKLGTATPITFSPALEVRSTTGTTNSERLNACGVLYPVRPNTPIEIQAKITSLTGVGGFQWANITLAVEP